MYNGYVHPSLLQYGFLCSRVVFRKACKYTWLTSAPLCAHPRIPFEWWCSGSNVSKEATIWSCDDRIYSSTCFRIGPISIYLCSGKSGSPFPHHDLQLRFPLNLVWPPISQKNYADDPAFLKVHTWWWRREIMEVSMPYKARPGSDLETPVMVEPTRARCWSILVHHGQNNPRP